MRTNPYAPIYPLDTDGKQERCLSARCIALCTACHSTAAKPFCSTFANTHTHSANGTHTASVRERCSLPPHHRAAESETACTRTLWRAPVVQSLPCRLPLSFLSHTHRVLSAFRRVFCALQQSASRSLFSLQQHQLVSVLYNTVASVRPKTYTVYAKLVYSCVIYRLTPLQKPCLFFTARYSSTPIK